MPHSRPIAVIGAGIAGLVCARTLVQAGHAVTVFERNDHVGGRMATRESPFGGFDHGAQYFTVRDARLERALQTVPGLCKPWSANVVRVLDPQGRSVAALQPSAEPHWVATPGMDALAQQWARPLQQAGALRLSTRITRLERTVHGKPAWTLHGVGPDRDGEHERHAFGGFDAVVLAMPARPAQSLLEDSDCADDWVRRIDAVQVAPCWVLMLAFPQAMQPGLSTLGPQWNAARSTHHRIAWLARESSKPLRGPIERWTVQASGHWSREHLQDTPERVMAKLLRAFSEITGIRAQPSHAQVHCWRHASTEQALGVRHAAAPQGPEAAARSTQVGAATHLWDDGNRLGVCGDWCIGNRVEDAFVSGLDLALRMA